MRFVSTNDPTGASFRLAECLRLGPAPDGGLFVPEALQPLSPEIVRALPGHSLVDVAEAVLGALLGDALPVDALRRICADALDFPMPVRRVTDDIALLELFHGPTLAFKDVGARFLARLLPATADDTTADEAERGALTESLVLVATSGDTGGAVAQAFHGVAGTRVVILYPEGKVSPLQERQFTTLGGNVSALAVDGAFDDCQRLVKAAFADRELSGSLGLTSANSINLGRLLPQAIYYVHALGRLAADRSSADRPLLFVVPSGNFGNLTAGLLALRLLPEDTWPKVRFVAATNANDVVPEYLAEGIYRPRPSVPTLSNAMDVGDPSNLARIRHLYGDDLEALRHDVRGVAVDDGATREVIARILGAHDVLLDPHTAVGWRAAEQVLADDFAPEGSLAVVLATAHPAKFAEVVEPVIGRSVEIPERLARHLERPVRSRPLEPTLDALRVALRDPSSA